jgi:type III restriction enzyme
LIIEIKGQVTDNADVKAKAAHRWIEAVNRLGQHGIWHYLLVTDPGAVAKAVNVFSTAQWDEAPFDLK